MSRADALRAAAREVARRRRRQLVAAARLAAAGRPALPAPSRRPPVTVTLTSYRARIRHVAPTVRSLLAQDAPPDHVVLVLARGDVPELPAGLGRLRDRGLEVHWVDEDTRSYKKLLPVLAERPGHVLVTVDDDTLYPQWWLARLLAAHEARPDTVLGFRGQEIAGDAAALAPYVTWPGATTRTPGPRILLTGVGGVLYPPGSLPARTADVDLARRLCPTADDVWFRAMTLLAGTPTAVVDDAHADFPETWRWRSSLGLAATNVLAGRNDEQVRAVLDHFGLRAALDGR